jgi:hypothetical protein
MGKYWRDWIKERFGNRPALTRAEAIRAFWSNLPNSQLAEFFDLIKMEYGFEAGLLRPEDNLELLTAPIKTRNPLRWFAVEPRLEDAASELNYQICQRAEEAGLIDSLPVSTVRQFVSVWCGVKP